MHLMHLFVIIIYASILSKYFNASIRSKIHCTKIECELPSQSILHHLNFKLQDF